MACSSGGDHRWKEYKSTIPGSPKRRICSKCAKIEDVTSPIVVVISSLIVLGILAVVAYYFGLFADK